MEASVTSANVVYRTIMSTPDCNYASSCCFCSKAQALIRIFRYFCKCTMSVDDEIARLPCWLGILGIHLPECITDNVGNSCITSPFVVRRDDMPRRIGRRAPLQHHFIGLNEFFPISAIIKVGLLKLPPFIRVIEALL